MLLKFLVSLFLSASSIYVIAQQSDALKATLKKTFPNVSEANGQWVYFDDDPTLFKSSIIDSLNPGKQLFKVYLTNFLGRHVSSSPCIIIADKQTPIIRLIEPFNYSGEVSELSKLIVGKMLADSTTFVRLLDEIQCILAVGGKGYFDNLQLTDSTATFDYLIPRGYLKPLRSRFVVKHSNYIIQEIQLDKNQKSQPSLTSSNLKFNNEKTYPATGLNHFLFNCPFPK